MPYTLRAIQELIGAEQIGDGEQPITGVQALPDAREGQIVFAEDESYLPQVRTTQATAIIVTKQFPDVRSKLLLRVGNPRAAFAQVMALFQPPLSVPPGIHQTAVVSPQAVLGPNVTIGEYAVVRDRAQIGEETVIDSGVHIGIGVILGKRCVIGPSVVLRDGVRLGDRVMIHSGSVIGDEGFGYVWWEGQYLKIPQLGTVIIEDDVEIGTNVCVDRATLGATVIRRGTKIDNLVQIAHNDVIGQHVIMSGQVGLAGSITVGDRVLFGGQAGVVDHVTIGDDAKVLAATIVTKDVKAGESVLGYPAREARRAKREMVSIPQLPQMLRQLKGMVKRLAILESRLSRPALQRKKRPARTSKEHGE
jgi:UDP-3-O-[3-hydroxymyristoyl] glucosamine N-acyltransferase